MKTKALDKNTNLIKIPQLAPPPPPPPSNKQNISSTQWGTRYHSQTHLLFSTVKNMVLRDTHTRSAYFLLVFLDALVPLHSLLQAADDMLVLQQEGHLLLLQEGRLAHLQPVLTVDELWRKIGTVCHSSFSTSRAGMAQLVKHQAKKPGTVLTQVRFLSAASGFSPGVDCQRRLSYGVHQPPCAVTCTDIYAHIKNHEHWQPSHCLDAQKYCRH